MLLVTCHTSLGPAPLDRGVPPPLDTTQPQLVTRAPWLGGTEWHVRSSRVLATQEAGSMIHLDKFKSEAAKYSTMAGYS